MNQIVTALFEEEKSVFVKETKVRMLMKECNTKIKIWY